MKSDKKLIIVIIINFAISVLQVIGGFISGSLALISDSVHNFGDTLSLAISLVAVTIGKKKRDLSYTYGYKRAEILGATVNSAIIIMVAFYIGKEAVIKLLNPKPVQGILMLSFGLIGIIANAFSALLLYRDSKDKLIIKSAFLHLLTDSLTSVSVVIGSIFIIAFKIYIFDSIITLFVCIFIFRESIKLLIESVEILMQKAPPIIKINDLKNALNKVEGVDDIHHIHMWKMNDSDIYFECHAKIKDNFDLKKIDFIREKMEDILINKFSIKHTTIQFEISCCKRK
ncbi:MAG: cation transporter [Candidatus Marinimicrobia bacterium]|nr:cation transporter [Candidatus Neomarinimicrobiota bacterium]